MNSELLNKTRSQKVLFYWSGQKLTDEFMRGGYNYVYSENFNENDSDVLKNFDFEQYYHLIELKNPEK